MVQKVPVEVGQLLYPIIYMVKNNLYIPGGDRQPDLWHINSTKESTFFQSKNWSILNFESIGVFSLQDPFQKKWGHLWHKQANIFFPLPVVLGDPPGLRISINKKTKKNSEVLIRLHLRGQQKNKKKKTQKRTKKGGRGVRWNKWYYLMMTIFPPDILNSFPPEPFGYQNIWGAIPPEPFNIKILK